MTNKKEDVRKMPTAQTRVHFLRPPSMEIKNVLQHILNIFAVKMEE